MPSVTPSATSCFTDQHLEDYSALKQDILDKLRRAAPCSELIWDISDGMHRAVQTGWWLLDMPDDKDPKREVWARNLFSLSYRQASKYFKIREGLTRSECVGLGLGVDRLYQIALSPQALRPVLVALGQEGLSPDALSEGRRAGVPLLGAGLLGDARLQTQRVARGHARHRERKEAAETLDPGKPAPAPLSGGAAVHRWLGQVLGRMEQMEERGELMPTEVALAVWTLAQQAAEQAEAQWQRAMAAAHGTSPHAEPAEQAPPTSPADVPRAPACVPQVPACAPAARADGPAQVEVDVHTAPPPTSASGPQPGRRRRPAAPPAPRPRPAWRRRPGAADAKRPSQGAQAHRRKAPRPASTSPAQARPAPHVDDPAPGASATQVATPDGFA